MINFLPSLNEEPICITNYGASLKGLILEKIKKSSSTSLLSVSGIRLLDKYQNLVENLDVNFYFSGSYFHHNNNSTANLYRYFELEADIVRDSSEIYKDGWIDYSYGDDNYVLLRSKVDTALFAKYKWIDTSLVEYIHFVKEEKRVSGHLEMVEKSFYRIDFDPETYEEQLVPAYELVKIGKWKIFDQDGKLVKIREFDNGVFVKEFDVE